LADILSKRDNLYQSLARSKSTSLDFSFYNSFNNKFFGEIHSILPYIHTDLPGINASRSLLFPQLTTSLGGFGAFLGGGLQLNLLPGLFSNLQNYEQLTHSFRSQYKPMRRGITNMVRLQATNAIAMPTEIRLHILASSKDVIHSWAIPSAGIKIDCVPGYSSHRVAVFLVHGIFWGQCMEICGRYHH